MIPLLLLAEAVTVLSPPVAPAGTLLAADGKMFRKADRSKAGAVLFSLFIDPQGRPLDCSVSEVAGFDYRSEVCQSALTIRFQPARDLAGKQAYGLYRNLLNFYDPDDRETSTYPIPLSPDLTVSVKPGTGNLEERKDVRLFVVIDGVGNVRDCRSAAAEENTMLEATACAQLRAQWIGAVLEDPQGKARDYIRSLTVSFVPER